jgi:hypothetical protein
MTDGIAASAIRDFIEKISKMFAVRKLILCTPETI